MTHFQQITAQRREQRRYEKRVREQAMAVYRQQMKLAQEQADAIRVTLMPAQGDYVPAAVDRNKLN